jgi:S1-C subfamily serine protease
VKFNGKPVTDFYDLPRLLADDVISKETKIAILRGEKLMTLTITPTVAEGKNDE